MSGKSTHNRPAGPRRFFQCESQTILTRQTMRGFPKAESVQLNRRSHARPQRPANGRSRQIVCPAPRSKDLPKSGSRQSDARRDSTKELPCNWEREDRCDEKQQRSKVVQRDLAEGLIDVALGPAVPVKAPLYSEDACVETGALVVKRDHGSLKRRMSREAFNSLKHIDIEIAQGRRGTGYRLAQPVWLRQGLRREVALSVPSFTAALMAAARTEYIAAVPRRTAQVFCKMLPLKIVEADFELPVIRMALTWHARTNADEGSRYFRKLVLQCLRDRDS